MNVMIVDDNEKMRQMIMNVLRTAADRFIECTDGSEVLAAYDKYHPDWILMDVVMTRMDGISATLEVTRAFPEAKIIIVTQYNDNDLHEKAMRAGAIGFVLKENLIDIMKIMKSQRN